MQTMLEDLQQRIERLEDESSRIDELGERLARVERRGQRDTAVGAMLSQARPEPATATPAPVFAPPRPAPQPLSRPAERLFESARRRPEDGSLEDLVGGRLLAWAGGIAVVAAIVCLFAMAISRGWLDEAARTVLGGGASLALGAIGLWLQERRSRTDAALAAVATSAAGLFVTVTVAARVYEVIPAPAGVALALVVAGVTTLVALRWEAPVIGALGLIGGLLAPVLAGAPSDGGTIAVLAVAALAATTVCVRMRWTWLSGAVLLVCAPQWGAYLLGSTQPGVAPTIATLLAFGALGTAAAIGHDVRKGSGELRAPSAWMLAVNALLLAGVGWWSLSGHGDATADAWLVALACLHLSLGAGCRRWARCADDLGLVVLAIGTVLADVAIERLTDGVPSVFAWLGGALVLGALTRDAHRKSDARAVQLGLGGHLAMAIGAALTGPASPTQGPFGAGAAAVLLALAATSLVCGRLVGPDRHQWRWALDGIAITVVAYLTALSFDGPALVVAWAVESVALATLARRTGDPIAAAGAVAQLALAAGHAVAIDAPLSALFGGDVEIRDAGLALGAVGLAAALMARERLGEAWREHLPVPPVPVLAGTAGVAALHLISIVVVVILESSGTPIHTEGWDLPVHQQAQMALSATWAILGVLALVGGLVRDERGLRLGALALLGLAVTKVWIFDLAQLDALYRVGSFLALGLLLLTGAFAWQRIRPRPVPDLRAAPPAAR